MIRLNFFDDPFKQAYDRDYRDGESILDELVPAITIDEFALF